jgi:hypothetical protein
VSYIAVFGRCLLAVVFLVSAVGKLRGGRQFREFATSLAGMRLLPARAVRPVAALVATAELTVPLLLAPFVPASLVGAGLAVAAGLLTAFAVAIGIALRRRVPASCRCFGGSGTSPLGPQHVVRNAVLVLVACLGAYASSRQPTTDWRAIVLAAPPALAAASITIRLDELVSLFAPVAVQPRR